MNGNSIDICIMQKMEEIERSLPTGWSFPVETETFYAFIKHQTLDRLRLQLLERLKILKDVSIFIVRFFA